MIHRDSERGQLDLVVAGLIIEGTRVLLIHHASLGKWLPPGGHIEPGETPDHAVVRELAEETGLVVELLDYPRLGSCDGVRAELALPFYVNVHGVGDHEHCCFFYRCRVAGGTVRPGSGVIGTRWVDVSDLDQTSIPADVRAIVALALGS